MTPGTSAPLDPRSIFSLPAEGIGTAAFLFSAIPGLVTLYVLLYAPGQAWWRGEASALPRGLARAGISIAITTTLGLVLTALDVFSLPRLAVLCGTIALIGYVAVARVRHEGGPPVVRMRAGAVVALLALWLLWPPYETHLAASDSTTYTAAGVHLARAHHLWKYDPLIEELSPLARRRVFFSVLGHPWKPPYARMPGGLVIETPDSPIVRPGFFPAPAVWSALAADLLGARYAGAYAPLFAALALAAFFCVARRRIGHVASVAAVVLAAANAAGYWAGRFALSEPLAWFFVWAAVAALDAYDEEGFAADAGLAGALLGATAIARIEYLAFILAALAVRYLLRADTNTRPLPFRFHLCFVLTAALAVGQVALIPGAYASPLADGLAGLEYRAFVAWQTSPAAVLGAAFTLCAAAYLAVRRFGVARALAAGGVVGFLFVYTALLSHMDLVRTIGWLRAYLGTPTLVLGLAGAWICWRERFIEPGNALLALLVAVVATLLVYDAHVFPNMPWASRRFVPVVIPALILFAVIATARLAERSRVAGVLAGILLSVSVAWPAKAMWGMPAYRGTYATLERIAETLPDDGILLIDNRLIPLQLATPLWLAYDRNSLPVDASTADGRRVIAGLTHALAREERRTYLVKPSRAPREQVPLVITTRTKDFEIVLQLPQQTLGPPPAGVEEYVELVSVFELRPWRPPPKREPPAAKPQPSTRPKPLAKRKPPA